MTRSQLLWIAFALLLVGPIAMARTDNPLEQELGKTLPVVVVVPHESDPLLKKVKNALKDRASRKALRDRNMVLYTVVEGQGRRNNRPMEAEQTMAIMKALGLDSRGPAAFVLLGKDGAIRMREGGGVELHHVLAEVDRIALP